MIKGINIIMIVAIIFCMGISIAAAKVEEEPDIVKIIIESEKDKIKIGNDKAEFYAMVVTSDGEIVRNSEYSKVRWYIQTKFEKVPLNIRINETSRLVEDKNSKYYGCHSVTVKAPYGLQTNVYRIFAENIKLPMFDQEKEFYFITDYNDEHFMSASKGKVEYGTIEGNAPIVYEKYDYDKDAYLITFPRNKYTSKYNEFVGWKYEDKIYQPGETMYVDVNSMNRRIVAQWKPIFFKPQLVVKKRSKMLTIDWSVVPGANKGYKAYRSTKRNGKYKLIKKYWYYVWDYFEDGKVKKGKTYWYKVKAIKKDDNGKLITRTSDPVKMSLDYSNVRHIRLNRKNVSGKVGAVVKMKAKVKRINKKKYFAEKVRWYSSDSSIAKIGKSTGTIKLMKEGRCTIYCTSFNGQKSKEISVVVK